MLTTLEHMFAFASKEASEESRPFGGASKPLGGPDRHFTAGVVVDVAIESSTLENSAQVVLRPLEQLALTMRDSVLIIQQNI